MNEPTPAPVVESLETSAGPIELVRAGSGPPVVFLHGTPGGSDSSVAMGRFLIAGGFSLIAPSRPGYLGTQLAGRESIDAQADLIAATLDALGHRSAGVLSWSGGGPSGYRLAVRHPDRVAALVGFAAVSGRYVPPAADLESRLMVETRPGNFVLRMLAAHAPKSTISGTLAAEGDLTRGEIRALTAQAIADEQQRDVVLTMAEVVADRAHRRAGIDNDLAQFARIESLELGQVECPTLIIHGDVDTDVPPEQGERAAREVPGAQYAVIPRGTHLSLFVHPQAEAFEERVLALFRRNLIPS